MRTRIALATAAAVIVLIPAILFGLFSSSPPASARAGAVTGSRHEAGSRRTAARIDRNLMSYAEAQKAANQAAFYNALTAQEEARFFTELTFFKEIAFITALTNANSVNAIPPAWMPTAICEEGGRDDPNYGYFGIKQWNGFDGYPTAGSAPLSAQLAWEATYIGAPPDAPGQCHGY